MADGGTEPGVLAACPTKGPRLPKHGGAIWRMGLGRREARLLAVEGHGAKTAGLLTERTRRNLRRTGHIARDDPGEPVCLDTFFIGKLKGVGQLWQITACDPASSYAWAKAIPARNAVEAARFLARVLVPQFAKAGWKLRRVLTDRGSKLEGEFERACRDLGVTPSRTRPRHAWTNGFVERLQRSSTSPGGWCSDEGVSPARASSRRPWRGSHGSQVRSGRTQGTGPREAPRRRCCGERRLTHRPRRSNVTTALRYWTPYGPLGDGRPPRFLLGPRRKPKAASSVPCPKKPLGEDEILGPGDLHVRRVAGDDGNGVAEEEDRRRVVGEVHPLSRSQRIPLREELAPEPLRSLNHDKSLPLNRRGPEERPLDVTDRVRNGHNRDRRPMRLRRLEDAGDELRRHERPSSVVDKDVVPGGRGQPGSGRVRPPLPSRDDPQWKGELPS